MFIYVLKFFFIEFFFFPKLFFLNYFAINNSFIDFIYNKMIFIYIFSFLTLKLNIYIKNTFYVKFFFLNYLFHIDTANCIDSLNLSLINKINNIHPVLLYIVFMKIFIKKYFRKVFLYKYYLGIFIYMSLFLGGYWSNQEINWGGWWDWDPIELILFFFNVLLFVYIHLKIYLFWN